jgi:hypothetical protein
MQDTDFTKADSFWFRHFWIWWRFIELQVLYNTLSFKNSGFLSVINGHQNQLRIQNRKKRSWKHQHSRVLSSVI